MAVKNEYAKVLEILAQQMKGVQRHNKLVAIQVVSEDSELVRLLSACITAYIEASRSYQQSVRDTYRETHDNLRSYCQWALSNAKPQWQIEAERHGWKKMP